MEESIIEVGVEVEDNNLDSRRKAMIPKWIKVFGWLFITMGTLVPVFYIAALVFGFSGTYSIFGISYEGDAYALMPALISLIIFVNGVVAYGLLFGKNWGVLSCLVIGYLGLLVSVGGTVSSSFNTINFEPVFLIPYLYFLHKKRSNW